MVPTHTNADVLIIGTGPAGRVLGAYLARQNITTRIIEKRATRVLNGQADGLNPRSCEILQSLGLLSNISKHSAVTAAESTWLPDKNGVIERAFSWQLGGHIQSRHHILGRSQGRTEQDLEEAILRYSKRGIEYSVAPLNLEIDQSAVEDNEAYPVTVPVHHLRDAEASKFKIRSHTKKFGHFANHACDFSSRTTIGSEVDEIIHAKYVVGCDGAWSWTRDQLGIEMSGEPGTFIWGVIDIIPITNFPDQRRLCTIQSTEASILWIPREHGLVRIYTQIKVDTNDNQPFDRSRVTVDQIFSQVKANLAPFEIDYRYCDWWTVYQTGQRISSAFHDPSLRIFLAGDAVHNHSPLIGLGMNTSIADAYNLGWKLSAVIQGQAPRKLLSTYKTERMPAAENIICFDKLFSSTLSVEPSFDDLKAIGDQGTVLGPGTEEVYRASNVVMGSSEQLPSNGVPTGQSHDAITDEPFNTGLLLMEQYSFPNPYRLVRHNAAPNVRIGARLPPHKIKFQASLEPTDIQERLPADGRWRILVFAADILNEGQLTRVKQLGERLAKIVSSAGTHSYRTELPFEYSANLPGMDEIQPSISVEPLLEVLTVHSSEDSAASLVELGPAFITHTKQTGRRDDRVFTDDGVYEACGVAMDGPGCMILCRPDQHVAWVGGLDDDSDLERFLKGCMILQSNSQNGDH